ncbi:MAG: hypothetical protein NUV65_05665 [Candidatus Roizmanbacteria bacterium]|nr:hypothetical protein [Candidatus Roizmanbacteria bacterium]
MDRNAKQKWYKKLIGIVSTKDLQTRYLELVQLHATTTHAYISALEKITKDKAKEASSDGRSVALVVAHIMAWEEWQIQIFTDQNKEKRLQKQMILQGYYDTDTQKIVDFKTVDAFNAYSAKRYSQHSWQEIKQKAVHTALKLQSLFPITVSKEWIDFLQNSPKHNWKILPKITLTIPSGWYLWMVSLEHEAVEHAADLY